MTSEELKHSIENRLSVEPHELTEAVLREAGCFDRVCVLPAEFNERVSYLGDALVQMLCKAPKDDNLRATVGKLTMALSYLLNSCSWREGVLHDFDLDELKRKLGRLAI